MLNRFPLARLCLFAVVGSLLMLPSPAAAGSAVKAHRKPKTRALRVRVTFYCAACDPSHTTRTGRAFRLPGVAVDPRLIPLRSRVFVPGYGLLVADDTARLIRGRHIDVRLPARGHCDRLGVRRLCVKVLPLTMKGKNL